jgi:hypothetical protein
MLEFCATKEHSNELDSMNGGIQWGRNSGMSSSMLSWHEDGLALDERLCTPCVLKIESRAASL